MRFAVIFSFLFYTSFNFGLAQVCSGNLGENIFTEGDFGSGAANILQTNPQIAPGYIYSNTTPVQDGRYTITNDIGSWGTINGWGWKYIGDNSFDPQGYMMVVNASFNPGLFYQQQVTDLCENSLFQFSADIYNLLETGRNGIKPNVSFLIDGQVVLSTGDIPENERWNSYNYTFNTAPGQSSVTLALRNNAPGGQGNDLAIDNISFRACGPRALIKSGQVNTICNGNETVLLEAELSGNQYPTPFYQWQRSIDMGANWTDVSGANSQFYLHNEPIIGEMRYRYLLANSPQNLANSKCRILSTPTVIEVQSTLFLETDTLCEGESILFGNQVLDSSGVYLEKFISRAGCDSTVVLNLTIKPDNGLKAQITKSDPSCSYLEDGFLQIDSIYNGESPFLYELNGSEISISDLNGLDSGTYNLVIKDRYRCKADTTFQLFKPDNFILELGEDEVLNLGESAFISPESNFVIKKYTWSPIGISDCESNCLETPITPSESIYLKLLATSDRDCQAEDSLRIEIQKVRKLFIPNVFTPNGDGYNDAFGVVGEFPNATKIEKLAIYDRWGRTMLYKINLNVEEAATIWDGSNASSGTYFYKATVRFLDDELINYTGHVQLLK